MALPIASTRLTINMQFLLNGNTIPVNDTVSREFIFTTDDDLYYRVHSRGYKVVRYPADIGRYESSTSIYRTFVPLFMKIVLYEYVFYISYIKYSRVSRGGQ